MYYCISYDIGSNKVRRFAVKCCKQAGLLRLQRSVFTGASTPVRIAELEQLLQPLLAPDDRLVIIPLENKVWRELTLTGSQPDKATLSRSKGVVYF